MKRILFYFLSLVLANISLAAPDPAQVVKDALVTEVEPPFDMMTGGSKFAWKMSFHYDSAIVDDYGNLVLKVTYTSSSQYSGSTSTTSKIIVKLPTVTAVKVVSLEADRRIQGIVNFAHYELHLTSEGKVLEFRLPEGSPVSPQKLVDAVSILIERAKK